MVSDGIRGRNSTGIGIQIVGQAIKHASPYSNCLIEFLNFTDSHNIDTNLLTWKAQAGRVGTIGITKRAPEGADFCSFSKPIFESKSDSNDFELLSSYFGPFRRINTCLPEVIRS